MLKKSILVVVCFLSISVMAAANDKTLVVLGDSLSAGYGIAPQEGWVHLLQERLTAQGYRYQVINASISGDTTRAARARLAPLLATTTPDIVIIELGGNDGLRGISIEEMHSNLSSMVNKLTRLNVSVLLIPMQLPPNYGQVYTAKFMQTYAQVAAAPGVTLGTFILQDIAGHAELMQSDGIHPQANAQLMMLENVWPDLKPLLRRTP